MSTRPQAVGDYLRGLQQRIVAAVEAADGGACVRLTMPLPAAEDTR